MLFVIKSKNRIDGLKRKTYNLLKKYEVPDKDINIFVSNEEDYRNYKFSFPNCKIIKGDNGIVGIDNFIVDYFDEGVEYIYMNDDVSKLSTLNELNKKVELDKDGFYYLISKLFSELRVNNLSFGGIYVCDNAMYMTKQPEITNNLCLIMDPFSAVINNKDVKLTEFPIELEDGSIFIGDCSDAEKCIQHFKSKGGIVRLNKWCMKCDYYNNDGGGIVGRNKITEKLSKEGLMKKYPKYISSINFKKDGTSQVRLRKLKCKDGIN